MKIDDIRKIIQRLEEILKEEEKLTNMYFDMTIIASRVGADHTYQEMTDIGETVGDHQKKIKQLIARFRLEERRQAKIAVPDSSTTRRGYGTRRS